MSDRHHQRKRAGQGAGEAADGGGPRRTPPRKNSCSPTCRVCVHFDSARQCRGSWLLLAEPLAAYAIPVELGSRCQPTTTAARQCESMREARAQLSQNDIGQRLCTLACTEMSRRHFAHGGPRILLSYGYSSKILLEVQRIREQQEAFLFST